MMVWFLNATGIWETVEVINVRIGGSWLFVNVRLLKKTCVKIKQ